MNKKYISLIILGFFLGIIFTISAPVLAKGNKGITNKMKNVVARIAGLETSVNTINTNLENTQKNVSDMQKKIDEMSSTIQSMQNNIDNVNTSVSEIKSQTEKQQEQFGFYCYYSNTYGNPKVNKEPINCLEPVLLYLGKYQKLDPKYAEHYESIKSYYGSQ